MQIIMILEEIKLDKWKDIAYCFKLVFNAILIDKQSQAISPQNPLSVC